MLSWTLPLTGWPAGLCTSQPRSESHGPAGPAVHLPAGAALPRRQGTQPAGANCTGRNCTGRLVPARPSPAQQHWPSGANCLSSLLPHPADDPSARKRARTRKLAHQHEHRFTGSGVTLTPYLVEVSLFFSLVNKSQDGMCILIFCRFPGWQQQRLRLGPTTDGLSPL